jgi:two-component system, OmpR family, phosphate regulon response regulator PhoB
MGRSCNCRVLIAEEDCSTRESLIRDLEATGCRVVMASDGEEALAKARSLAPELLVLDMELPELSGTQVLRELKSDPRTSSVAVIVVTPHHDDSERIVCLELGADDCVSKPCSPREIVLRARALVFRNVELRAAKPSAAVGVIEMHDKIHEVRVHGRVVDLTALEYKMLRVLLGSPGRVFSREEMLDAVWGPEFAIGGRTIDTHLRRLRVKLGKAASQVETVRGFGYRISLSR